MAPGIATQAPSEGDNNKIGRPACSQPPDSPKPYHLAVLAFWLTKSICVEVYESESVIHKASFSHRA
jgi:hypothetical protein